MFSDLLAPGSVVHGVRLPSGSPHAVKLDLLQRAVAAMGAGPEALEALAEREASGSTGFGGGIALPHARLPGLAHVRGAVMLLAEPVDWQAVDGMPVDLFFCLVGPEEEGVDNLKALARASRAMRDGQLVAKLRGCRSAAALWALLAGGDARAAA